MGRVMVAHSDKTKAGRPIDDTNPFPVKIVSGSSSGTQYDEGDTQATATGTAALYKDSSNELNVPIIDSSRRPIQNIQALNGTSLVADNAAAPGTDYPIPIGGQYNATAPTYSDGDRTIIQTDANGKLITSGSSGGSSAGGSGIIVGYEAGSYTFDKTAKTITFTGLGTVELNRILLITNVTDQVILYNPSDENLGGTIASNVLTLEYDTTSMDDADKLQIYYQYDNSEDYTLNSKKVIEQAPSSRQNTNTHIVDEANESAATYRTLVNWANDNIRTGSFHINVSGGVTVTIWASNDDTADDSADTGWIDVSSTIMGSASLVDSEAIYFIDTGFRPDRLMIKRVTSDATNASDVWVVKSEI